MHESNLAELRVAVEKTDWLQCENILRKILINLGKEKSLQLAVSAMRAYLPFFERVFPDIQRPRAFLASLEAQEDVKSNAAIAELTTSSPNSNANNFFRLLELLDEVVYMGYMDTNSELGFSLLQDVIAGSINLRRFEYWASQFPDDAPIAEKSAQGQTNLPQIQSKHLREPKVQAYTKQIWFETAIEMERLLNLPC